MLKDNYNIKTADWLNNDTLIESPSHIKYKGFLVPTWPFPELSQEEFEELKQKQHSELIKEIEVRKSLGLLSESQAKETLNQYAKFFFHEGLAYKMVDIEGYIYANKTFDRDTASVLESIVPTLDPNVKIVSRSRIRELTGFSFHTKVKHSPEPVYLAWQDTFDRAIRWGGYSVYVLDGSRQLGKSLLTAELLIEFSFLPKFDTLIASFEAKATQRILNYINKFTKNFDEWTFVPHKQDWYIENTFSGSKIYFSTLAEDGDKVRGLTLSLVVVDEAQLVGMEEMESGVLPTLLTTGWPVILLGTASPWTDSYMYDCIVQGKSGKDPGIYVQQVTLDDNPLVDPKTRERIMMRLKNPNSYARTMREYFCKWGGNDEKIFYPEIEEWAMPDYSKIAVLGIDPARKQDNSAFTVLEVGSGKARSVLSAIVPDSHKNSWQTQAQFFLDLQKSVLSKYKQFVVAIDATGVGDGVFEIFRSAWLRNMSAIRYTTGDTYTITKWEYIVGKSLLINRVIDLASAGNLSVCKYTNGKLLEELDYAQVVYSKSGKISFESRFTDDSINSLLISVFLAVEKRLVEREQIIEVANNYWFIPRGQTISRTW